MDFHNNFIYGDSRLGPSLHHQKDDQAICAVGEFALTEANNIPMFVLAWITHFQEHRSQKHWGEKGYIQHESVMFFLTWKPNL